MLRFIRFQIKKTYIFIPLAGIGAIFWLSSIPGDIPDTPGIYNVFVWVSPNIQNLLHVPVYAGLAWLWCWSLQAWLSNTRTIVGTALVLSLSYGVFDEWHQSFVTGRYASLTDVMLNGGGILLGLWMFYSIGNIHRE